MPNPRTCKNMMIFKSQHLLRDFPRLTLQRSQAEPRRIPEGSRSFLPVSHFIPSSIQEGSRQLTWEAPLQDNSKGPGGCTVTKGPTMRLSYLAPLNKNYSCPWSIREIQKGQESAQPLRGPRRRQRRNMCAKGKRKKVTPSSFQGALSWNTIEMLSITALAHLKAAILFFLDMSGSCGYSIAQQAALFHSIKPFFTNKPLIVVCNKIDLQALESLLEEDMELVAEMKSEAAKTVLGLHGDHKMEVDDGALLSMRTLKEEGCCWNLLYLGGIFA
eukprot:Gb_30538 [translate_table: standard]